VSVGEDGSSRVRDHEAVAREALSDISPAGTVGALLERIDQEDGTATLRFLSTMSGYPGWYWSVSIAEVPGEEPTVMEAELMPGDGALLAPDWVPWAERLEDYRAAQALIAAEGAAEEGDDLEGDDLDDDESDDDEDDDDEDDDFEDVDDDELAVPLRGIDEQDEAEAESDDDGPEQPDEV
jgi:hypothetical protein